MEITNLTRADFDHIVSHHSDYWDNDLTLRLHHPMFIHEFGDTAFVIKDDGRIAAYLLGFYAQTGPVAYVHMVAAHPDYRRHGLARKLYDHFIDVARKRGCTRLKATASPLNDASIRFHLALGMRTLGTPNEDGIDVVKGYLSPGDDRVVMEMDI